MKRVYFLILIWLIGLHAFSQTIRYVKTTGLQGAGYPGPYSWQNHQAYRNLQDAINDSNFGDEVWVAQGTYIPIYDSNFVYTDTSRWSTFVLKEGVKVRGSFQGLPGQEGNLAYQHVFAFPSVLSGDLLQNDQNYFPWPGAIQMYPPYIEDNAYSIVRNITPLTSATLLEHFVIKHAFYLDTTIHPNFGNEKVIGAVFLKDSASPILSNLIFIQNRGHIGYIPGFVHFPGIQSAPGSAITVINSSPLIKQCQFYRNFNGAAIAVNNFMHDDTVFIRECYFLDNYGGDAGATIFAHGAGNIAMINCLAHKNFSNYGTGLMAQSYWSSNPLTVTIQNGTYLENNMISTAYSGRLFYLIAPHGGLDVKVSNSLFWHNGPKNTTNNDPNGLFYYDQYATLQIDNSIVEFGWPHYKANVINSNPLFVSLPSTNLSPLDFDYTTAYNVYSNSPAINPGLSQLYFHVPFDINGHPRDNNPDLSSFEFSNPIPSTGLPNNQNVQVYLYPNPVTNHFYVEQTSPQPLYVTLHDMMGKEVTSYRVDNQKSLIHLNSVPPGMYVVSVTDNQSNVVLTKKLFKIE